jgi:glycosyltransferase involved in cell wall biosynthesis
MNSLKYGDIFNNRMLCNNKSFPLVSILIPTYNRAQLLQQALNSALKQHYRNIQIIVSDNASIDDTQTVLNQGTDTRVIKYRQVKNVGSIKNINTCLSLSTGEYILVLSDDDLLMPDCISSMVEQFLAHPSATIAYGQTRKETINGELIINTKPNPALLESGSDYVMNWIDGKRETAFCCTLFRSSCLIKMGGFPDFPGGDTAARSVVALQGDVIHINKILAKYRVHQNSDSHSFSFEEWIEEIRKMVVYISKCMPTKPQKEFLSRSLRYTIRAAGRNFGDFKSIGRYRGDNLKIIMYCISIFGWKDFFINWPWLSVSAKVLLSNKTIKRMRHIRNFATSKIKY